MFGVKYDTWKSVCDMYFSLKTGSLKAYLQWFPFTKLTKADKDVISSEEFYNKYIKTGSFVLFPPAMHQSENFLQKSDGSFRDSSLVGPILYLMLQAVGKEIYDQSINIFLQTILSSRQVKCSIILSMKMKKNCNPNRL